MINLNQSYLLKVMLQCLPSSLGALTSPRKTFSSATGAGCGSPPSSPRYVCILKTGNTAYLFHSVARFQSLYLPSNQVWITLHIWFPRSNRLASTDQIFGTPSYSGLLTDISFMFNRRSDSGRLKFRHVYIYRHANRG